MLKLTNIEKVVIAAECLTIEEIERLNIWLSHKYTQLKSGKPAKNDLQAFRQTVAFTEIGKSK